MMDSDLQSPFDNFDAGSGAPTGTGSASWLPPGAVINADGSITLANGNVMPAPPPGYARDPNTGVVSLKPGATPIPGLDPKNPTAANPLVVAQAPPKPGPDAPPPTPTGGGGDGTGTTLGNLIAPYDKTFTAPTPAPLPGAPTLNLPPGFTPPPAFSYKDFVLPTGQEVLDNDPGYAFREQQGMDSITNNAAAQGTVRGGATLKNLVQFGQNYASGEYGNAVDRAFGTYQTNRGNAVDNYKTNYQTQYVDPYNFDTQAAKDLFGAQNQTWQTQAAATQRGNEDAFSQGLDAFNTNFGVYKFNKQWPYTVLSDQQRMGLQAAGA